jgi:hypothetical protein
MRVNPAYIQWIGDLIIPILGFIFWDWSLYFILLFILLDMFTKEVVMHAKAYHVDKLHPNGKAQWLKKSVVNTVFFMSFLLLVHVAVLQVFPTLKFTIEWSRFWTYEDLGIQQGYVLLPILAVSGYMQFKQSFVLPNMAAKLTMSELWSPQIKLNVWRVLAASTWIGVARFIYLNESVWIGLVLGVVAVYQWITLFRQPN